jgi:dolichol-phosphate mannosyltransferase
MLRFGIDGITSFSIVPVRLATWLGVFAGLIAVAIGTWAMSVKLSGGFVVPGWTTIMMMIALSSAAQLVMTGILGEYVGRIYEEVKRRPLYTVAERHGFAAHGDIAQDGRGDDRTPTDASTGST